MNTTFIFVILAMLALVVIIWNLFLPLGGSQNQQFVALLSQIFRENYDDNSVVQKTIDEPIVTPIKNQIDMFKNDPKLKAEKFSLGPRLNTSPKIHNVTLTFYIEYGNNKYVPDLLGLLYKYDIKKAVFFIDPFYAKENPYTVQRIQFMGYTIKDWKNINEFDKDYMPTVFNEIPFSGQYILSKTKKDIDAVSFFEAAVRYYDASVVAFNPKIMNHPALLESLLKSNGKDLLFTDNMVNTQEYDVNPVIPNRISKIADLDPILSYLNTTNTQTKILPGNWTMSSLEKAYPGIVSYIPEKNAYLVKKQLSIDKDTVLDMKNQNILLYSSNDKRTPPAIMVVRGLVNTMNTTITSFDPALDGPNPNGYNPRSHILVRDGGKMDIINSTLTYLGYSLGGIEDTRFSRAAIGYYNTTDVVVANSTLANSYYGFYSAYTKNIVIDNSKVFGNTRYGLDPHTFTSNLYVSNNHIHDNGNQGFICSLSCLNVTVINNVIEHNVEGIGIHWLTNSSMVKDNIVRYNAKNGIFIQKQSFDNLVINNTVIGNMRGISLQDGSNQNTVTENILVDNIIDQINIEPTSKQNEVYNNFIYTSENLSQIPEKVRDLMTEIIGDSKK